MNDDQPRDPTPAPEPPSSPSESPFAPPEMEPDQKGLDSPETERRHG